MKRLINFLLVLFIFSTSMAQQKPVYERSNIDQVLSDRATWSQSLLALPHGPTPYIPLYVPDSLKCGGLLFYKTAPADTSVVIYNCSTGNWDKLTVTADLVHKVDSLSALTVKLAGTQTVFGLKSWYSPIHQTSTILDGSRVYFYSDNLGSVGYFGFNEVTGRIEFNFPGSRIATNSRISGADATSSNEFTTKKQLDSLGQGYDMIVILGQSNNVAPGDSTLSVSAPINKVIQFHEGILQPVDRNVGDGTGNSWPAFAAEYYKLTGRKIVFVPAAVGGTALLQINDSGNGNWSPTGTLYSASLAKIDSAKKLMTVTGRHIDRIILMWAQGEQDANNVYNNVPGSSPAEFKAALQQLIANYRTALNEPELPFYITRLGKRPGSPDRWKTVRGIQVDVAASDPWTQISYFETMDFYTRGLLKDDDLHYSQKGQNLRGLSEAQQVVQGKKYTYIYEESGKVGVNITEPSAYLHLPKADTIPALRIEPGLSNSIQKNSVENRGDYLYYTDSLASARQAILTTTNKATISGKTLKDIVTVTSTSGSGFNFTNTALNARTFTLTNTGDYLHFGGANTSTAGVRFGTSTSAYAARIDYGAPNNSFVVQSTGATGFGVNTNTTIYSGASMFAGITPKIQVNSSPATSTDPWQDIEIMRTQLSAVPVKKVLAKVFAFSTSEANDTESKKKVAFGGSTVMANGNQPYAFIATANQERVNIDFLGRMYLMNTRTGTTADSVMVKDPATHEIKAVPSTTYTLTFSSNVTLAADGNTATFNITYNNPGYTPSNIVWIPTSSTGSNGYYITNISNTSFTVNFNTPPAAGTATAKYTLIR
ncbi:sialate O-acetylesterase [Mucilaginibacter litoreus]|uniref:Sialate O-acetylesterase n=1 Tax=Mucilaginibacter litoreus TaxID=1048221 RepID=A0ABW3AQF0_9SPHI